MVEQGSAGEQTRATAADWGREVVGPLLVGAYFLEEGARELPNAGLTPLIIMGTAVMGFAYGCYKTIRNM